MPVEAPVAPSLSVPAQAMELVKTFEGCRLKAYPDPGPTGLPVTIGYGCTRDENGDPWSLGDTITQERAMTLLARDMGTAARDCAKLVHVALSEPCRAALVDFLFNLGDTQAVEKSTLFRLVNAGKLKEAAEEFPKWNLSGGKVLNGLVARRAAERKVFLSGIPA